MRLLRGILALAICLCLEAAMGRWVPSSLRYVDVMLVPVAWYGIARSQRSAMLTGCVAGLIQDAWFETAVFGINGFKKTLLGFVLGGLGSRFDINQGVGWVLAGMILPIADRLLEAGLLRLLDRAVGSVDPIEMLIRAGAGGLLVAAAFSILVRVRGRKAIARVAG